MDVIDVICYLCNQKVDEWRQNLAELQSKHSKMSISDFFKRLLNDFVSQRNIEDEANRICLKCLEIIDDYDLMCVTAVKRETELREMLLQTEQLFDGHQIKTELENDVEMCHSETVFVKENSELNGNDQTNIATGNIKTEDPEPSTAPRKLTEIKMAPKSKKIFIQKKGNRIVVRLVKRPTSLKPVNTSALKLTAMSSGRLKSNEVQSLVAKLQAIKTISDKHLDSSEAAQAAKSKSAKPRAPKTPRTPCQKCNDGVLYKKWHYQVTISDCFGWFWIQSGFLIFFFWI